MRETAFIQQNKDKWREFERITSGESADPDKLNDLFIQVTDDLSYARTFYKNRSVRVYLNGLAQKVFFNIYKGKSSQSNRFATFWADKLPRLLYEARRELLLSFSIFTLATLIGMLSCHADPDFVQVILGDRYVEMTKENISSGDPMAVYKEKGEFNMFLGITLNNIMVSFYTFILGIFYAVGTVGILISNGIMLGAFQYFFIQQGLFQESFLTVWMHGAFEISSIVIAGAAGLTMGRGLVFPGTLSRLRAFQLSARRGLGILMGTIPIFIVAGFTESYVTRHTDMPDVLRGVWIFLCFFFMYFYFVIFPAWKAKRGFSTGQEAVRLSPEVERSVDFSTIKNTGDLFTDGFIFFRKNLKPIVGAAALGSAIYCVGAFLWAEVGPGQLFFYPQYLFGAFTVVPTFFHNENHPLLFPFSMLAISIVLSAVQQRLAVASYEQLTFPEAEKTAGQKSPVIAFLKILPVATLLNLMLLTGNWLVLFVITLTYPFLLLWAQVVLTEKVGLFSGLSRAFALISGNFGQMFGLFSTLLLCGALFYFILDTSLLWFLLDMVSMNFFLTDEAGQAFLTILTTFLSMFVLLLIFGLWAASCGLQYFSNLEVCEANFLLDKIRQIQTQQRIRGMERE